MAMRFKVCAVKDVAIGTFSVPQFVPHTGASVRAFGDAVRGPKDSPLAAHPNDFELWYLGEYDDQSGEFDQLKPERLARGVDFVNND